MNKGLNDFLNNCSNAYHGEFTVSREKNSNGWEYIHICIEGVELYRFWYNKKHVKSDNPKHTGGKKSYIKVLIEALDKRTDLSLEASGFILKLSNYINWKTNLIVDKRSKKAFNIDDFCRVLNKSKPTIVKIIKELKTSNLLTCDKEGYKISHELLQKGGK